MIPAASLAKISNVSSGTSKPWRFPSSKQKSAGRTNASARLKGW